MRGYMFRLERSLDLMKKINIASGGRVLCKNSTSLCFSRRGRTGNCLSPAFGVARLDCELNIIDEYIPLHDNVITDLGKELY